jgi:alpha-galactosidase
MNFHARLAAPVALTLSLLLPVAGRCQSFTNSATLTAGVEGSNLLISCSMATTQGWLTLLQADRPTQLTTSNAQPVALVPAPPSLRTQFRLPADPSTPAKFYRLLIQESPALQTMLPFLAPTPPTAYTTWWDWQQFLNASAVSNVITKWATNGLLAAGWDLIWLDDGWNLSSRDTNGDLAYNPSLFPDGIKPVADYAHAKGFRFGIYVSYSAYDCLGLAGTTSNTVARDVALFARWGMDAIKVDACHGQPSDASFHQRFVLFGDAMIQSGRPMVLLYTVNTVVPRYPTPPEAASAANVWEDGQGSFYNLPTLVNLAASVAANDASLVGKGHYCELAGQSDAEIPPELLRAWVSLAAILSSPLIISDLTPSRFAYVTNREVLSVLRDPAAICGSISQAPSSAVTVWSKPLGFQGCGTNAVVVVNTAATNSDVVVSFPLNGYGVGEQVCVKDLWAGTNVGTFTAAWTNSAPPNSAQMFLLKACHP